MLDLKSSKVLLTGGAGFLGSFVREILIEKGVSEDRIIIPRSKSADLRDLNTCRSLCEGIDVVVHLAARCGGIGFNQDHPGDLFYDNLIMGTQMMEAARIARVKKFVAVGTICAYPKFASVPFKESDLWSGYPEETNAPYGLAKKMMLVQSQAYRAQYGFNSIYLLPVNLYGPRDHFDPEVSHVIPALIKKFFDAKIGGRPSVEIWGTGSATREFCHARDAARGIVLAAERYEGGDPVNIGTGMEISIKELAELIKRTVGYEGDLVWNSAKPDGQPRRCLDTSVARSFGYEASIPFEEGIQETVEWYRSQQA
jgi:GDP-L-fucose synthase